MNPTPHAVAIRTAWTVACVAASVHLIVSGFAGLALGVFALPTVVPSIRAWALERRMARELRAWLHG